MIYYSDEDKARMAISALLIFLIGYALFLQIGGYVVAGWFVLLSLAGIGACWFQRGELRKQRQRMIRSAFGE